MKKENYNSLATLSLTIAAGLSLLAGDGTVSPEAFLIRFNLVSRQSNTKRLLAICFLRILKARPTESGQLSALRSGMVLRVSLRTEIALPTSWGKGW